MGSTVYNFLCNLYRKEVSPAQCSFFAKSKFLLYRILVVRIQVWSISSNGHSTLIFVHVSVSNKSKPFLKNGSKP